MQPPPDLIAAYWTLAIGAEPHTTHDYSTVDFRERVAEAARAGYKGVGIWHSDLIHSLQKYTLKDMRQILDDHGIRHVELEFLTDWFMDGERRERSDAVKQGLFAAAAELGARCIKVGDFLREPCPMPRLIESFAALCREAENYGTRIAFEMMPFCTVDTLPLARELAEGAAARNGGIYFDLWHIVKLNIPYASVAAFPRQYLAGVELNDGYLKSMPDLVEETTQHRKLCGEGEFDIRSFIDIMLTAGYSGPWGVEVLSRELRRQSISDVATRSFDTTIRQFR